MGFHIRAHSAAHARAGFHGCQATRLGRSYGTGCQVSSRPMMTVCGGIGFQKSR